MKKYVAIVILLCITCVVCFSGCGTDYESSVKEHFISDASMNGYAIRLNLEKEVNEKVSFYSPEESDISVTTITEGKEYVAEGDIRFVSANSGSTSIHCKGTYIFNDSGEVENTAWDMY